MHIPRQPNSSWLSDRAHREHLVARLRSLTYWQRLVQARTDLLVAGLLYDAPAPWPDRVPTFGTDHEADRDLHHPDLHGLGAPPLGVDLDELLGIGSGESSVSGSDSSNGTCARLERLRAASALLEQHRRDLLEQLDGVNLQLHAHVSSRELQRVATATNN